MDEAVTKAMAKWPQVPDVYGWLRLDGRGNWYLIDRNQPGFNADLHGKGSPITSPGILDFIGRNYACDERGCWYWQNGPQRAFAELDAAPVIYRRLNREALPQGMCELVTHTGYTVQQLSAVACDLEGRIWLISEHGPGIMHDLDASTLDIDIEQDPAQVTLDGKPWPLVEIGQRQASFGFIASPLAHSNQSA